MFATLSALTRLCSGCAHAAPAPSCPAQAAHAYTSSCMLRLTQAPNLAIATLWADALGDEGIVATVQRQYLGGMMGELPPDQCLPEVWIRHPEQEVRAKALLHDLQPMRAKQCLVICLKKAWVICKLWPQAQPIA